jgi:hypothetical protein
MYVVGSFYHAGFSGADTDGLISSAAPLAIPLKEQLKRNLKTYPNLSRYKHFNLIRFNDAEIGGEKLTKKMRKGEYELLYSAWRTPIRTGLKAFRRGAPGSKKIDNDPRPKWTNSELNDLLYAEFKKWYAAAAPKASTGLIATITTPRTAFIPGTAPLSPMTTPPAGEEPEKAETEDEESEQKSSIVPILAVAGVAAFLFLRKKG